MHEIAGYSMRHIQVLFFLGFAPACAAGSTSFTVDSWGLGTYIIDSEDTVGIGSTAVYNPFHLAHDVYHAGSNASSYFDFSWSPDTASFQIQGSHAAFDGNGGTRSASSGSIRIVTREDLLLTVTGYYEWDLPSSGMALGFGLDAYDQVALESFFGQGITLSTALNGPETGRFDLGGQAILPAGREITFFYNMHLDGFGGTGLLASGEGFIEWTLAPVPECSTIVLLGLCMAFARNRGRRVQR